MQLYVLGAVFRLRFAIDGSQEVNIRPHQIGIVKSSLGKEYIWKNR